MKLIILIALALTLSASDIKCKTAKENYQKNFRYYGFALEKQYPVELKHYGDKVLTNIEQMMVECQLTEEQTAEAKVQRSKLLPIVKKLRGE